jgi:hypothetical protein
VGHGPGGGIAGRSRRRLIVHTGPLRSRHRDGSTSLPLSGSRELTDIRTARPAAPRSRYVRRSSMSAVTSR